MAVGEKLAVMDDSILRGKWIAFAGPPPSDDPDWELSFGEWELFNCECPLYGFRHIRELKRCFVSEVQ